MAALVHAELERIGIDVRTGVAATAIEPGDELDTVVLGDGSRIEAELIVLSVGVRPDTEVFEAAGCSPPPTSRQPRRILPGRHRSAPDGAH